MKTPVAPDPVTAVSTPEAFSAAFVNRAVAKVVLAFAAFSGLWILLSDQAVLLVTSDPKAIALLSTLKGWAYVVVTASLLAVGMRRYLKHLAGLADELRLSEERWNFALRGSGDGVWDWNLQTGKASLSPRWKEQLGYTEDEIGDSGDEWTSRLHPEDAPMVMAALEGHIAGRTPSASVEFRMKHKDGRWIWIHGRGMVFERDPEGKAVRLVGTNTDITERKQLELELQLQARIDSLTGVLNRRHFLGQAELELGRAFRYDKDLSLLMVDIDFFKQFNDTYGHMAGDTVLERFAAACQQALRAVDVIGRVGGEEFAILLPETGVIEAAEVAERLRMVIADTLVDIGQGRSLQITASIGVASICSTVDSIDTILSRADEALYAAKHAGRNRVEVASR